MKRITFILLLFVYVGVFGQQTNKKIKTVSFTGSGYELGLQHGKALKSEIDGIIKAWKNSIVTQMGKDADSLIAAFSKYAKFNAAIKAYTPDLYKEIKGIAKGSGQTFQDIMALNLMDEFWVYIVKLSENHHCSGVGVPAINGNPGYISQNMDLGNYTDGFQVLMRLQRTPERPEQLILTFPGLIALNGLNEKGVGVCVNTLMQLNAASMGLPVAFVIRRIINTTDKDDLLSFIQEVKHASGQNYIIGIRGEVFDYEASTNKVVRFNPRHDNGSVYHTNHPIVNDDIKRGFEMYNPNLEKDQLPADSNSYIRLKALEKRVVPASTVTGKLLKEALRSRDSEENPICNSHLSNGYGFTFASVIITMAAQPFLELTGGPPDESEFERFDFSETE